MAILKKYKFYILSFVIPFIIMLGLFVCTGMFNSNTMMTSDLGSQTGPLFVYLKDLLHGNATFPYSFSKSLGGSMYATFFYFLANPINLFAYFFEKMDLFFIILFLIKISLCGLTAFIYLKRKAANEWQGFVFALAYAFMGYNLTYLINVEWLDAVILAPLILLGIERFVSDKKPFLYIITLIMGIIFNYYIGYMLALFSCIYFFYLVYLKGKFKDNWKLIRDFLLVTILIGLMMSFILIPSALESANFRRMDVMVRMINFSFPDLFAGTYIGFGSLENPLNYYGFLIYSGTVMIPLVIYYFTSPSVSKREKRGTLVLYLLFLLPIFFMPLNIFWHMFTIPQGFNFRYSFLATLFTLIIALRSLKLMDGSNKALKIYFVIYFIIAISLCFLVVGAPDYYFYLTIPKIIITLVFLALNIILIIKKKTRVILIVLIFELLFNLAVVAISSDYVKKDEYYESYEKSSVIGDVCSDEYRCEMVYPFSLNESFVGGYHGLTSFLSTTNYDSMNFLYRLRDRDGYSNFYHYADEDLITDMLLGIKYIGNKRIVPEYELIYKKDFSKNDLYLFKNKTALSLGYLVSSDIKHYKSSKRGIYYLEELLQVMENSDEKYITYLDLEKVNDKKYLIKKDKIHYAIYVESENKFTSNVSDIVDEDHYSILFDTSDKDIELSFKKKTDKIKAYTIDYEKLEKFKKNRSELKIDKNTGNYIKGTINAKENGVLFTSIPYENGFKVYVDDKLVDNYKVLDTFLAIDLEKGNHKIEIHYEIPGLKLGIIISAVSFIILIFYVKRRVM